MAEPDFTALLADLDQKNAETLDLLLAIADECDDGGDLSQAAGMMTFHLVKLGVAGIPAAGAAALLALTLRRERQMHAVGGPS